GQVREVLVPREEEFTGVVRQLRLQQMRGEQLGGGLRGHDAVAGEAAEQIVPLDGRGTDARPVLARLAVVAAVLVGTPHAPQVLRESGYHADEAADLHLRIERIEARRKGR